MNKATWQALTASCIYRNVAGHFSAFIETATRTRWEIMVVPGIPWERSRPIS